MLERDQIGVTAGDPSDVADIRFLLAHRYYPLERVPPRAMYLLEELCEGGAR